MGVYLSKLFLNSAHHFTIDSLISKITKKIHEIYFLNGSDIFHLPQCHLFDCILYYITLEYQFFEIQLSTEKN